MNVLAAILLDSLRESVDRKAMAVLLVLSTLVIAFCASVTFIERTPEAMIEDQVARIGWIRVERPGGV